MTIKISEPQARLLREVVTSDQPKLVAQNYLPAIKLVTAGLLRWEPHGANRRLYPTDAGKKFCGV